MTSIICDPRKGGCEKEFPLDKDNNRNERWLECPYCGRIMLNPFYNKEE